jgi:Phage terminase, small subunit
MPQEPRSPPSTSSPPLLNSIAPSHTLGEAGQSLWDRIQREYAVEDSASVEVLTQVCLAADRASELATVITRDGATIQTKDGPRQHPAAKGELAARAFVIKGLRELGLTQQSIKPVGRPSGLPTMRGQNRNANRSPAARSPDPWGADD